MYCAPFVTKKDVVLLWRVLMQKMKKKSQINIENSGKQWYNGEQYNGFMWYKFHRFWGQYL